MPERVIVFLCWFVCRLQCLSQGRRGHIPVDGIMFMSPLLFDVVFTSMQRMDTWKLPPVVMEYSTIIILWFLNYCSYPLTLWIMFPLQYKNIQRKVTSYNWKIKWPLFIVSSVTMSLTGVGSVHWLCTDHHSICRLCELFGDSGILVPSFRSPKPYSNTNYSKSVIPVKLFRLRKWAEDNRLGNTWRTLTLAIDCWSPFTQYLDYINVFLEWLGR